MCFLKVCDFCKTQENLYKNTEKAHCLGSRGNTLKPREFDTELHPFVTCMMTFVDYLMLLTTMSMEIYKEKVISLSRRLKFCWFLWYNHGHEYVKTYFQYKEKDVALLKC